MPEYLPLLLFLLSLLLEVSSIVLSALILREFKISNSKDTYKIPGLLIDKLIESIDKHHNCDKVSKE